MKATGTVADPPAYVLTDDGREALRVTDSCHCSMKLAGVFIECHKCGTVYGYARGGSSWTPDRHEWKRP